MRPEVLFDQRIDLVRSRRSEEPGVLSYAQHRSIAYAHAPDMFNQHSKSKLLLQWYFYQPSQDLLERPFNAPHSKHRELVLAIPQ